MNDRDGESSLIHACKSVASGDLSARLDRQAVLSLGLVGESFNAMLDSLQSQMKENERKISDSTHRLMEYQQLAFLGSLVAGMAHEINTQIGIGVTAASNLGALYQELEKKFENSELKRSDLESTIAQSEETTRVLSLNLQRAAEFVQTLKAVASDQTTGETRRFKVREYLETILLSLKPQLKRTAHTVLIECDAAIEVETSPGLISQIVTNLVVNSLVHGFAEGQSGTMRIEAKAETDNLILCYSDNGKGIESGALVHLFEPFFTTRKGKGGTGLGLYLIRQELDRHGGSIDCVSEPGSGVLFTVRLPVKVI